MSFPHPHRTFTSCADQGSNKSHNTSVHLHHHHMCKSLGTFFLSRDREKRLIQCNLTLAAIITEDRPCRHYFHRALTDVVTQEGLT